MITPLPDCPCRHCLEKRDLAEGLLFPSRMFLCPTCGNKRCPRAYNHTLPCSGSNEPGQTGSVFTTTYLMEHQITPPPSLIEKWHADADSAYEDVIKGVAIRAARWGADQELERVCEYIGSEGNWFADPSHRLNELRVNELRVARRPKPPSLAEQGLETLDWIESESPWDKAMFDPLRSALERLRELEGNG